jgi:O-methyltransferase
VRGIVRRLRDFSGPRLERAFFWAPRIQKVIRRRRWNQIARSGSGVLIDVEQLRPRLRQGLAHLSRSGKKCVGDYLEFGVFQGTSIICMWNVLNEMNLDHVRMFGFDSFEGMPDAASNDDGGVFKPGEFAASYDLTKQRLAEAGVPESRAVLIKGWFSDTLNQETMARHGITKAGVIMIDADIYTSSKQALNFCASLIQQEAMLVMDDWYAVNGSFVERNMGQPRALKEFLTENPHFQTADVGPYSFFGRLAGHVFILKRIGIPVIAALTLSSFEVQMPTKNDEPEERGRRLVVISPPLSGPGGMLV